jgi:REP element-mobilizing transposase RayT
MSRKPRLEYAGAVYHVMNRGNQQQKIFLTDEDRKCFLETLGEVCQRSGWNVHAYVLMGNHYHLLLDTPEPNLVTGMQWLQGTYCKRFNVAHRKWGHLFQGRYKAIPVGGDGEYLLAVANYIHLNPVRMKGYDFSRQKISTYEWSSYPFYVQRRGRPAWLCVDRILGSLNLTDTSAGRRLYADYMAKRILGVQHAEKPWEADVQWQKIRRGWCFGGEGFKEAMLELVSGDVVKKMSTPVTGAAVKEHDERHAERLVVSGLKCLGVREEDLSGMKKSAPEKLALAWLIRHRTSVKTHWIKKRLCMGAATNFASKLNEVEVSKKGTVPHGIMGKIKNIKI